MRMRATDTVRQARPIRKRKGIVEHSKAIPEVMQDEAPKYPLWVDPRDGSGFFETEMRTALWKLRGEGVTVKSKRMDAGDLAFLGNGWEEGEEGLGSVMVGVEFKNLKDLIGSLESGRMMDQVRRMLETYDVSWLLVEGIWRCGGNGELEEYAGGGIWVPFYAGRRRVEWTYLEGSLHALTEETGGRLRVKVSASREQTLRWIYLVWRWWGKKWEEHKMFESYFAPTEGPVLATRPDLVWQMAALFPGVQGKGKEVSKRFATVREWMRWAGEAREKDWVEVLRGKDGKAYRKLAEGIVGLVDRVREG